MRDSSHFDAEISKCLAFIPILITFYISTSAASLIFSHQFFGDVSSAAMLEVAMWFLQMMPSLRGWMRSWQPPGLLAIFDLRIRRKRQATMAIGQVVAPGFSKYCSDMSMSWMLECSGACIQRRQFRWLCSFPSFQAEKLQWKKCWRSIFSAPWRITYTAWRWNAVFGFHDVLFCWKYSLRVLPDRNHTASHRCLMMFVDPVLGNGVP